MDRYYCTVSTPSTRRILHVQTIPTAGGASFEARTAEDFKRLIEQHKVEAVNIYIFGFPRHAVEVARVDKHLKRLEGMLK